MAIRQYITRKNLIVCGVAIGVLWLILLFFRTATPAPPPAKEASDTFTPTQEQWDALKVQTVALSGFYRETAADGKIAANADKTTPVFSPYSGRIVRLVARPGDHVEKNAPLLEVEATEFSQGENDLVAALSTVATSRNQARIAQVKERRQHALYEAKAAAKQDWEQSQSDLEAARNTLRSAEAALSLVKNRLHLLGRTDAEITAQQQSAGLSGKALVLSPIAGTVIDRQAAPGQFINSLAAGATAPLYTVGDLSTVWLEANVRESDALYVHAGDNVEVHVLAFPQLSFKAALSYVAPSVDAATHRLPVRAEVDNAQGLLKPEMFASFTIRDGMEQRSPAVPESAVVYEGDNAHVWVAGADHSIALRSVHTGQIRQGSVQVVDGLKAGENVVTGGALFIDRAVKSE